MKCACSYCGRIHERSFDCGQKPKKIDRYVRKEEERGRYTWAFTEKSKEIKRRSKHLCAVCLMQGVVNYENIETHHITKLTEAPELLTEDSNLICLCSVHHRMADRGKLDPEMLRELARRRDTPQGVDLFF